MITKKIGGDRLGSGGKMNVQLKGYERSTHDLSYIWRSTMSSGTLVPFMSMVGLPADTFDIELEADVKTHPTIGPLFGSYKLQLDLFVGDIRLYQGVLHNNKLKIGMKMSEVKLPQLFLQAEQPDYTQEIDNQQINPSCIFSYLNIRGLGRRLSGATTVGRYFNGVPLLMYWDVYKNYYANKQEEVGAVIHTVLNAINNTVNQVDITEVGFPDIPLVQAPATGGAILHTRGSILITYSGAAPDPSTIYFGISGMSDMSMTDLFNTITYPTGTTIQGSLPKLLNPQILNWRYQIPTDIQVVEPKVRFFPLENLDEMREDILTETKNPNPFIIDSTSIEPYKLPFLYIGTGADRQWSKMGSQEGLAIKTYQSDIFNNWMQTEWLDGTNGINEITAVDTSSGSFTIDTLNLSKKVYDMLNRIAISGGTYYDWMETVYDHEVYARTETPIYVGGLSKELVFDEVISNSESSDGQPLGTLAGRGVMNNKHKGGKATVKVAEHCYVMGIVSLTPRIDYSQGNAWDTNLETMDDFHKPALDEIGFQDLITDEMAWWDTGIDETPSPVFNSAGKQPAWINYMTNYNKVLGNFAIRDNEMWMTLNRRYEPDPATKNIKDLTTYIDPVKFNNIFAETSLDAQNFWVQIKVGITARRKMSAKIMPNL